MNLLKTILLTVENDENKLKVPYSSTPISSTTSLNKSDASIGKVKSKLKKLAKRDDEQKKEKLTANSLSSLASSNNEIKIKINSNSFIDNENLSDNEKSVVESNEKSFEIDKEKLEIFKNGTGKNLLNMFFEKNENTNENHLKSELLMSRENRIEKLVAEKLFEQIDKFFTSTKEESHVKKIALNDSILMNEKRDNLKNFSFKTEAVKKLVKDYLKFSQILSENKYLLVTSLSEHCSKCSCFYNMFECCIYKFYDEFTDQDDDECEDQISFNLLENCCNSCTSVGKKNRDHDGYFKFSFLKNKNLTFHDVNTKLKSISHLKEFKSSFLSSSLNLNCVRNKLECCVNYLHSFMIKNESKEEDLDQAFINYLCCSNINKSNDNFLKEPLDTEENEQASLSFRLVEDEEEEDGDETITNSKTSELVSSFLENKIIDNEVVETEKNDKNSHESEGNSSDENQLNNNQINNNLHESESSAPVSLPENKTDSDKNDETIERVNLSKEENKSTSLTNNTDNKRSNSSVSFQEIKPSKTLPLSKPKKTSNLNHDTKNDTNNNTNTNKVKKSVQFIQDPKYGLMYLEIPEWQETFREPVYSSRSSSDKPEWKLDPIKNSYDNVKSILKKRTSNE